MSKKGKCRQCLQEKILHKKSHIIPEFMFRSMDIYDGKDHSLIYFDFDNDKNIGKTATAPYEKHIFCKECEKMHSIIETNASNLLFHDKINEDDIIGISKGVLIQKEYKNIDIDEFYVFLILILFRADFSSRKPFLNVNLGPYREKFRQAVNNTIHPRDLNCKIYVFNFKNHLNKSFQRICSPFFRKRADKRISYSILIGGIGIFYHFKEPTIELLLGTDVYGEKGLRINIMRDKKSLKMVLESVFSFPKKYGDNIFQQ